MRLDERRRPESGQKTVQNHAGSTEVHDEIITSPVWRRRCRCGVVGGVDAGHANLVLLVVRVQDGDGVAVGDGDDGAGEGVCMAGDCHRQEQE